MDKSRRRHVIGLVLAAVIVLVAASPPLENLANFPREMKLPLGERQSIDLLGLPLVAVVKSDQDGILRVGNQAAAGEWRVNLASPVALESLAVGRCRLDFSLLGILPLRSLAVVVVPRPEVMVGGQSIGILLRMQGVSIAGHSPVDGSDGRVHYPAREAGLKVGDIIIRVDGVMVKSSEHVVYLVNKCAREGRPVEVEVARGDLTIPLLVHPIYSERERIFQLGLFVRDGAAGVGTLTFYDPDSRMFMALGHVVSDTATNQPLHVSDGWVVRATVAGVRPGKRGEPGEKEGTFVENQDIIGPITANTEFGLVGTVTRPEALLAGELVPVALAREVTTGPVEIRTVVDGTEIRSYAAEITRLDAGQDGPAPKGMTIRITDEKLIAATGGIVQGMSGSPIIQNGKLVGAVTHVFVNDPTRGYGVFAEWMLEAAGLERASAELMPVSHAAS